MNGAVVVAAVMSIGLLWLWMWIKGIPPQVIHDVERQYLGPFGLPYGAPKPDPNRYYWPSSAKGTMCFNANRRKRAADALATNKKDRRYLRRIARNINRMNMP